MRTRNLARNVGLPIAQWRSVQAEFFFNAGPGNARPAAVGFLDTLEGAGVLDILDGVAHLAEQGPGPSDLLVQQRPVGLWLGTGESGVSQIGRASCRERV